MDFHPYHIIRIIPSKQYYQLQIYCTYHFDCSAVTAGITVTVLKLVQVVTAASVVRVRVISLSSFSNIERTQGYYTEILVSGQHERYQRDVS